MKTRTKRSAYHLLPRTVSGKRSRGIFDRQRKKNKAATGLLRAYRSIELAPAHQTWPRGLYIATIGPGYSYWAK